MDAAAMAIAVGGNSGPGSIGIGLGSSNVSNVSHGSNSSSSSSASSGYGSATTTPTTPTTGGQYEGPTATPMATIATVAPFYSEALTSLDAQHRYQQQQQQQQQQHQQQQQQQQHFYHQNYNYNLDAYNYSAYNYNAPRYEKLATSVKYNSNSLGTSSSSTGSNSLNSNHSNSLSSNSSSSNKPQAAATPFYAQPPPTQQMPMSMGLPMGNYASNSNPYEAAYKYKLPVSQQPSQQQQQQHQQQQQQQQYHNLGMMPHSMPHNLGMGMSMNLGAHKQQQQQQQQLQQQQLQQQQLQQQQQQLPPLEPSYAAIKPSSRYQNLAPAVYGSPGATAAAAGVGATSNAASSAYYDKYAMSLYSPNGAPLSFGAPAPLYSPPELAAESAYRKSATSREASCHWSVDYQSAPSNAGNTALPYPTAVAAPNTAATVASNELYYKYDKYAASSNPYQPYAARGMWPNAPDNAPPPPPATGRPSCCTQPFGQQSCYYPRSNGYSSVAASQYPNPNPNPSSNPAASHKLKLPTDLYAPYAEAQRSYGYANTVATPTLPSGSQQLQQQQQQQQRYMQPLNMGGGLEANVSTAYYNDLGSLDNLSYAAQQTHRAQSYQAGASLDYQYRKRPLPAAPSNSGYCLGQSTQPPLSNLEAHVDNYVGYELHATQHFAPQPHKTQQQTPQAVSSNSSNIRDFLASWNDDEEELPAAVCQMRGESVELAPQGVAVVAPVAAAAPPSAPIPAPSSYMYETLPPVAPAATAVVEPQVSELNLPDIIIDHHEKTHVDDSFGSFDVEKELDELRLKKSDEQQSGESDALAEILRDPAVVTEEPLPALPPALPLASPNTIPIALPEATAEPQVPIEFDQSTSNSNGSTFEKEYETFIHKIDGSDSETEPNAQEDGEYREHAKRFKFYKRKRKTTEPNNSPETAATANPTALPTPEPPTPKAAARASRKLLARRRRNRIKMLKILEFESPKIKHRFYFRTLQLLRRKFAQSSVRQQRLQRMRRQLELRKERRLPLIKRQSAMQYVQQPQQLQSPPSLKGLSDSAIKLQLQLQTETTSGRETVIKSGFAVRENLDCKPLEPKTTQPETATATVQIELDSGESNHTLQSVELLGSFKGFDDVENINLSPKAKLREEPQAEEIKQSKQLEIQRWLHNSMEDVAVEPATATTTIICLSSSSSSSSASSSSSSSSSSSDDSNSSSSSEEDKAEAVSSSSSSSTSSCSGEESDFNELAALQKELAVEPKPVVEQPASAALEPQEPLEKVSNKDIAKLKQILESDGDAEEEEAKSKEKPNLNTDEQQQQQAEISKVPKLSDLSKIALNSSLKSSELVIRSPKPKSPKSETPQPQRELSVEEALAEMYQQIGVASDPEDCEPDPEAETRKNLEESAAGADVLLINLAEIFDNNSNDLYVVQCDMNENILGVVNNGEQQQQQVEDRADTLQLIELLAEPEPEPEPEVEAEFIHHEEVVEVPSERSKNVERRKFLKYLHSKYVQSNISRFYHAQRVLKKYKRPRLQGSRVQSAIKRAEVVDRAAR